MGDIIQILGTVTDEDGNRIPNVNVTVNFEDAENISSIQKDENGSYSSRSPRNLWFTKRY
jgi:hypothetical protein